MNPASPLDLHDAILENSLAAPRDDKGLAFCRRNRHVAIQFALDVVLPFLKVGVRGRHAPIGLLGVLLDCDGFGTDQSDYGVGE